MAVQYIIPTGVGTLNQFTSFAGGDKWLDVDDPPGSPDDDASYLLFDGAGGSGATQLWTFATPTIPAEAFEITVHNHLRTRSMGTGGSNRRWPPRLGSAARRIIPDPVTRCQVVHRERRVLGHRQLRRLPRTRPARLWGQELPGMTDGRAA